MIPRISKQLGIDELSLSNWVTQADGGRRDSLRTEERAELKRLQKRSRHPGGTTWPQPRMTRPVTLAVLGRHAGGDPFPELRSASRRAVVGRPGDHM